MNPKVLTYLGYLGFITIGIVGTIIGPTLPYLMSDFKLNLAQAGAIFFLQFLGYIIAVLSGGIISDIVGKRRVILSGVASVAIGELLFSIAGSWLLILFFTFLGGLGFGIIDGGFNAMISDLNKDRRGSALNLLHVFWGVGALGGPFLTGIVLSAGISWRYPFLATGIIATILFILLFLQEFPSLPPEDRINGKEFIVLIRRRVFVLWALAMALYVGIEMGVSGWVCTYLEKMLAFPTASASKVLSLFWMGIMIGRLVSSRILKKLDYNRLVLICMSGSFFSLLLALFIPNPIISAFWFAMTGFFFSAIFPTIVAIASSYLPRYSGTVVGTLIAAGGLGGMLFPWLLGIIAQRSNLRWALLSGSVLIIGMLLAQISAVAQMNKQKVEIKSEI